MQKNLIAAIAASALLIGGVAVAVPVLTTVGTHKTVVADTPLPNVDAGGAKTSDTVAYEQAQQAARDAEAARIAAEQEAARVAAEQAAAAEAQRQAVAAQQAANRSKNASNPARGVAGSRVPFIPSTDPNNANGGDYADPATYCQSGSASGNPPVCD